MAVSKEEMLFAGGHSSKCDAQEPKREERKSYITHFRVMDAYSKHKKLVNDYLKFYGGRMEHFKRSTANDKTDHDVIRENHRFIWDEEDETESSWEKNLAKKYYDKLFKEYCISDLSSYKVNKFAMRWRIEKEVVDGKGQFICGNKKCTERDSLQSWEVNFGYQEHGVKKNALVKLRLCPECSKKLNFHHKRKAVQRKRTHDKELRHDKKSKKSKKKKRRRNSSSSEEDSSDEERHKEIDDFEKAHNDKDSSNSKSDPRAESDQQDDVWSKPVEQEIEKSRDEELDDYLEDLFL